MRLCLNAPGFSRWAGFLSFPESGVGFCCRDVYWLKCTICHVIIVIWLWLMPASNQSHACIISLVSLAFPLVTYTSIYLYNFPFLVFLSFFKHFHFFITWAYSVRLSLPLSSNGCVPSKALNFSLLFHCKKKSTVRQCFILFGMEIVRALAL